MRFYKDWVVGDVVYKAYTPAVVGVIRKIDKDPARPGSPLFTIEYLVGRKKGTFETFRPWEGLNLYQNLVEEHEAKAKRHRDKMIEIMKLV